MGLDYGRRYPFAQLFWWTPRSGNYTIREIDALVKCGQSPVHPSALRAATASSLLFLVSYIGQTYEMFAVALVLAGLIFILPHNFRYHYLDGETPGLWLRHSQLIHFLRRNQTTVRDIGLALAYINAARTSFVGAILIACSQLS